MQIYELLEQANLEKHVLTDQDKYLIMNEYTSDKWIAATKFYLKGLDRNHTIPGEVLVTMAGICDYWREHQDISPRQQMYLVHNLVEYWQQLSLEFRSWALT